MSTRSEVRIVADLLERHGVRFVVVGGQAVVRKFQRTTGDVDVMVTTADYAGTVESLRKDPSLTFRSDSDGVALFWLQQPARMGLDVLDAGYFSGNRSGQELFDVLRNEESTEADGIRYASVGFVWYTRLMVPRWETYMEKILADTQANAGSVNLKKAETLARRFGTSERIAPRAKQLREEVSHTEYDELRREV